MEKINHELAAVYILWLRQIKRHLRSKARLVMSIFQPVLFLVAFGFGFKNVYAQAGQGDYITFLAPGIVAMSVIFSAMFTGTEVISDKQFGFLKETLVAPISRLAIMLGRTLGGASVAMLQGLLVFFIAFLIGFTPVSLGGWLLALMFMFLIALMFTAFGTLLATFFNDMHAFPVIINMIVMPLFFLSGALFPVEDLPAGLSVIVRFNPLSYGVDGVRGGLTGQFHYSISWDFLVLMALVAIILSVGSWLFSRMES
ncbi:MAG TPA: ABC transporter permease [bacterium]|nr:ABC transporter permease [bacterium]HPN81037.1 ABC transporter permease [bacterium]HPW39451.1 ABC transporter permease [bacterium]